MLEMASNRSILPICPQPQPPWGEKSIALLLRSQLARSKPLKFEDKIRIIEATLYNLSFEERKRLILSSPNILILRWWFRFRTRNHLNSDIDWQVYHDYSCCLWGVLSERGVFSRVDWGVVRILNQLPYWQSSPWKGNEIFREDQGSYKELINLCPSYLPKRRVHALYKLPIEPID